MVSLFSPSSPCVNCVEGGVVEFFSGAGRMFLSAASMVTPLSPMVSTIFFFLLKKNGWPPPLGEIPSSESPPGDCVGGFGWFFFFGHLRIFVL